MRVVLFQAVEDDVLGLVRTCSSVTVMVRSGEFGWGSCYRPGRCWVNGWRTWRELRNSVRATRVGGCRKNEAESRNRPWSRSLDQRVS